MSTNEISELVSAQDKTTHAVRAIAVYILYSALLNVIGGGIIGISIGAAANSYDGLASASGGIIFGAIVITAGNVVGLISGLSELRKSEVSRPYTQQKGPMVTSAVSTGVGSKLTPCQHCGTPNGWDSLRCTNCSGIIE